MATIDASRSPQTSPPVPSGPTRSDAVVGTGVQAGNLSSAPVAGGLPAAGGFEVSVDKPVLPPPPSVPPRTDLSAEDQALMARVEAFVAGEMSSAEDAQMLLDLINTRMLELSSQMEAKGVTARQKEIEANGKEREQKIRDAADKASQAEKKGFWSKLWGIVKAVASVIGSALMVAAGVALTAVSGPVGLAIAGMGAYMLLGAVVDLVSEIKVAAGGEPISWRPSLGELAALIAKAAGASEETQMWWKLGVDLVVTVVMIGASFVVPGAQAKGLQKLAEAGKMVDRMAKLARFTSVTNKIAGASNVVGGIAGVGQGVTSISIASDKYDMKTAQAALDRLQALYDQLIAYMQQSNERTKAQQEAIIGIWDNAGDRLKTFNQMQMRPWLGTV
ncbi:MAG: hypothetical protein RL322_2720 [Pseudomonadota bacterium]|jgi:hypothetical protein